MYSKSPLIGFPERAENASTCRASLEVIIFKISVGAQVYYKDGTFDKSITWKIKK